MHGLLQTAKTAARVALGKDLFVRPELHCATERFGSDYGGWDIEAQSLGPQSVVYSIGIGEDASFDTALIDRYGLTLHAFDPTPKSIAWVKRQGFPSRFVMHEYGVAAFDGTVAFNPPENDAHVSHTMLARAATQARAIVVPVKRLASIMAELGHARIDLLKMDIEGAEYEVLRDIEASDIRPRQVLVEFHHRFEGVGLQKTREAIARLRAMGYRLFSVSKSNEEYSFLRA